MKIPRSTDVGVANYIEGDFLNLLANNQIDYDTDNFETALTDLYFGTSLSSMTLLEFASEFPEFGKGRLGDAVLYCGEQYLIPAEMEDTDSEEAVKFFEGLADKIFGNT